MSDPKKKAAAELAAKNLQQVQKIDIAASKILDNTVVKVVKRGAVAALQIEKTNVKSLQTIWKVLGMALGLFSRRAAQVLSASHQAIWLNKAEQILSGTGDLSYSTREASQFLARFDSLSSQWEVSVADIVFRNLLNTAENQPNNVETWAKKIDALIG